MSNDGSQKMIGMKIFLFLAFIAISILCYTNYVLYQKLEDCNEQLNYYSKLSDEYYNNLYDALKKYSDISTEFHNNLYAQRDGSLRDGAHTLSISDIYYRKYFKSSDDDK